MGSWPTTRLFISLKWKALLLTSLVLVSVALFISYRSYLNLTEQFEHQRTTTHQRYIREVESFIQQTQEHLTQLASVIPYMPGLQDGLLSADARAIRRAFEPQWPVLQIDWGLEKVAFYDPQGRLLDHWQVDDWGQQKSNDHPGSWVRMAIQQERPVTGVHCRRECQVYVAVPILADGDNAGALLVLSSLADALRYLRELSGHDVGLLITDAGPAAGERTLPAWGIRVAALTNPGVTLTVLTRASEATLETSTLGLEVALEERVYDLVLLPLPTAEGQGGYFAVIADITEGLTQIRDATREVVIAGGLGWLLSECLLLLILWNPLSRLRLTADTLPLLARGEFLAFRQQQTGSRGWQVAQDEIDHLNATAVSLAHRLEQLENEVAAHTRALSQRMEELARERDFVASLLQTAQVMIVTQDQQGRILMVNPFVCTLTGFQSQELIGQDFMDLLAAQRREDLRRTLQREMSQAHRDHLRHEALVSCKNGTIRNITWYHSRLAQREPDDPMILSVGLDITERRGAESRVAWLADHDALTGLLNRRRFQEELELALRDSRRQHRVSALLVIDLDQFKFINDSGGHQTGDQLLKSVAQLLAGEQREATTCARLGGDEFALLVRDSSTTAAIDLARRVQQQILTISVPTSDDQPMRVSASIGIVLFPTHADNVGELMACANLAVYQAKEEQRGGWHLFSEADKTRERMRHRVYWKDRVADALANDRFELFFQPIMAIDTETIGHYEVLIRMRDEHGQMISPAQFIDAAERGGMIHALDRYVVSKALALLAKLRRLGRDLSLSINLSGHAFSDPDLLGHIRRELERQSVPAGHVIFEITETAAVADFAVASNLMLAVKELGCEFALDDFGIGFSSFYYLKHLPVDYLKIDGSFIRQLPDSLDDQIIVEAIAGVARGFGKKLIAEYVETESTLPLLKRYGVHYAQGFLVGRPQPAAVTFPELGGVVVPMKGNTHS